MEEIKFKNTEEVIAWLKEKEKEEYKTLRDLDEYRFQMKLEGDNQRADELMNSVDYTRARWGMLTELLEELGVEE